MRLDSLNGFQQKDINYQSINQPLAEESQQALQQLSTNILFPLEDKFNELTITYGFTSFALLNYIKKDSPGEMPPERDQHAAFN
ncbi:MAG: hypothetical protein WBM99_14005 [Psychromonas sp.]